MSNRFHSKFHRQNHHTYTSSTNPDAGHDPIASPEQPFYGDFVLAGALSCVAPTSAVAGYFYSNNTALCAIAGNRGQYIYSNGNVGLEVYSTQSTAITAYAPYYGANINSDVFGVNVYGGQYGINTSSLVYGISSYAGVVAGSFYSPIRALSANGGQYGADVYSPNYGINSYGGNIAGRFYSPIRALSAYGGQYGLDVYSPLTAINSYGGQVAGGFYSPIRALSAYGGQYGLDVYSPLTAIDAYGGQVAAILSSPNISLSTGGGVNRFDSRVGIFRTPQSNYSTSPNIVLDVNGNSYFDGNLTITGDLSTFGNLSYLDTIVYTTSSLRVINRTASAASTFIQYGTEYPTLVCYDGDESLSVPTFTVLNKNIGINLSSPSNTFTVNSPTTISDRAVGAQYAIALNNTGGTNGDLAFGSDGNNSYIQSFNSKTLKLNSIGSNNIIIAETGGNVGVGTTTTPNTKLHVNGAITVNAQNMTFSNLETANTSGVYIHFPAVGDSGRTDWALLRQIGNTGMDGELIKGDYHMSLDLFDDSNSTTFGQQFSIRNVDFQGAGADIITTRFKIDGNGNVGINTDNPNARLTVNGTLSSNSTIYSTNIRTNQGIPNDADTSTNGYSFGADGDTGMFSPIIGAGGSTNGAVAFFSNNAEAMRIIGTNVGIGTTTPTVTLTVNGQISGNNTATFNNLSVGTTATVNSLSVNGTATANGLTVNGTISSNNTATVNNLSVNNTATVNTLSIREGSNARMGIATLVAPGSALVSTTAVAANSRIFLTNQAPTGTIGTPFIATRVAASTFTISSTNTNDRSQIAWIIVQPS
jgi:hypothetical protein